MLLDFWSSITSTFIAQSLSFGVFVMCLLGLMQWARKRYHYVRQVSQLPGPLVDSGPDGHPWLGHLGGLLKTIGSVPKYPWEPDLYTFFLRFCKEFKDDGVFVVWMFNPFRVLVAKPFVTVFDPGYVRQILVASGTKGASVNKDWKLMGLVKPLLGDSVFDLRPGEEWKFHRVVLSRILTRTSVLEHLNATTATCVNRWAQFGARNEVGSTTPVSRELVSWLGRIAIDIFDGLLFGNTDKRFDESRDRMYDLFQTLMDCVSMRLRLPPILSYLPTPNNVRFAKASKSIDELIYQAIDRRIFEQSSIPEDIKEQRQDLLTLMLDAEENGTKLTQESIFANLRAFLFAGQDGIASLTAFALWHLAKNPSMQQRLQMEVDLLFSDSPLVAGCKVPSNDELRKLPLLDAVINETLRLHNSGSVSRVADSDIVLKGEMSQQAFVIPKGTSILILPQWTKVSEKCWPDQPDEFLPDRFLQDIDTRSYLFPFSIGSRRCLGRSVSLTTIRTLLAHLIHSFSVQPSDGAVDPQCMIRLAIRPCEIHVDLTPRRRKTLSDRTPPEVAKR